MTTPSPRFPVEYVNKTVSLRFQRRESVFHLSHGLFSSNDIDVGTRLLLKSLAARIDLAGLGSVLDVGCGVGVLGITLARAGAVRVHMQDRDALAVAFARENCAANGVADAELDCCLAFWNLQGSTFDLIVSNLPAKAGPPVLRSFFLTLPELLSSSGIAAVVIVAPLEQLARDAVQAAGCLIFHAESSSQHVVLFFRKPQDSESRPRAEHEDLGPYLRGAVRFESGGIDYRLETAFNLPDFDTIGYAVGLAQEILSGQRLSGTVLFWNPGQGHLPVFAHRKAARGLEKVLLAGHDALELAITERNLASAGGTPSRSLLLPTEAGLAEAIEPQSVDLLCAVPHPVPKAPWHTDLACSAERLLRKGGALLAAGTSTDVFRVVSQCRRFRPAASVKRFGHRAVLLRAP